MTTTKLFKKKIPAQTYDKASQKPVIKASICNGEQIAGFKDLHTGKKYWYGEKELRELNEEYRSWENMEVSEDYR